ncbi:hypothetical protein EDC01DRAFT_760658 [Geopyxis carbonaria]|nr:hypothetical protein EDC01DRAFT_760658 [Geopyxis carbonaria]
MRQSPQYYPIPSQAPEADPNDLLRFDGSVTDQLLESQFSMPASVIPDDLVTWDLNKYEIEDDYSGVATDSQTTPLVRSASPAQRPGPPAMLAADGRAITKNRSLASPPASNFAPSPQELGTPMVYSDSEDLDKEEWPLRIAFHAGGEPRCCLSSVSPPITSVSMFFPIIDDACELDMDASKCILRYRLSNAAKASDPWMDLRKTSDARSLGTQVAAYLKTKRSLTPWYIAIMVIQGTKRGADAFEADEEPRTSGKRQKGKKSSSAPRKSAAAEHDEAQEILVDQVAAQITEKNRCGLHAENKNGCYVKPNGDHIQITPTALKYWACCLKDELSGVSDRNPPACQWFENTTPKRKQAGATGGSPNAVPLPQTPPPMMHPQHMYYNSPYSQGYGSWPPPFPTYPNIPHNIHSGMPIASPSPAAKTQLSPSKAEERRKLLELPLLYFLTRLQNMDTRHNILDLQPLFEDRGITPNLIPSMSDADLDEVLGKERMGIRLFIRKIVGRETVL